MSIGIWKIGIVIFDMGLPEAFGFSFGAWLWTLIPAFIRKMRKKSKKIFDKNFSYGWVWSAFWSNLICIFK